MIYRKTTVNKRYLITIAAVMFMLTVDSPIVNNVGALSPSAAAYYIPRHVEYGFTLSNTTDLVVRDAELWACIPIPETPTQRLIKLTASHPYEMTTDEAGNQMLHFTFQHVAPFDDKIINLAVDLMLSEAPDPGLSDNRSYIDAETYCESGDEEIVKLAGRLRLKGILETVKNIHKWVSGNIKYSGYTRGIKGARCALDKKEGDCTEFMYLFMALCRANRIPARGIGGFICPQDSLLEPQGYHNWAEFYDGEAWQIADPQNKVFMENHEKYIAMRYIGPSDDGPIGAANLFGFAGEGIKAKMN